MKSIYACITLLFVTLCSSAFAGDLADFELTDGSIIHGRLITFTKGRYTIQSKSLGTVTVSEDNVRLIRREGRLPAPGAAAKPAAGLGGPEVQGLVKEMQGNEEIMALIRALQDDPELRALTNDPVVMKAISAGDLSTLMANPQVMKLLNNPKVQEIQKKLAP